MSTVVLKIIACIAMFIGHLPFAIPDLVIPCVFIGKIAFPIFAFLISEGYVHTRDWKKYLLRLLVLAIISQYPAYKLFKTSGLYLNIFFTLSIGLISIACFDKIKNKYVSIPLIIVLVISAELLCCDYGAIGILMILFFYIFKDRKALMVISESVLLVTFYLNNIMDTRFINVVHIRYVLYQLLFSIISLIFILFYNGKKGKLKYDKYIFYLFYPVHLILLCILKSII